MTVLAWLISFPYIIVSDAQEKKLATLRKVMMPKIPYARPGTQSSLSRGWLKYVGLISFLVAIAAGRKAVVPLLNGNK